MRRLRDVELRLDGTHGLDSIADPLQVFARFDVRHALCLKLNQADDELVVVLGPVLELAKQGFLYLGQSEIFLQQFVLRSEEHTSELQSLMRISYAVFCLKNKNRIASRYESYYDNKDTDYK